jgi:hypothetical protein
MDKSMRQSAQMRSTSNSQKFLWGLLSGGITVVAVWFLMIDLNPPANFIAALLLAVGFWGAGSIPRLRARWQNFARELRLTAAGFAGVAGTILIFRMIW